MCNATPPGTGTWSSRWCSSSCWSSSACSCGRWSRPLLLTGTVIVSFGAALGLSSLAFRHLFGFAGADTTLPLYAFVFLVALGIDYNIFLMTRIREEATRCGTRQGAITALSATGGVITSAGLVLAATFAVLGTMPLVLLTELGFTVALGVLLDTFIVRSVLVTALTIDAGRRMWWPSRLAPAHTTPGEVRRAADPGPLTDHRGSKGGHSMTSTTRHQPAVRAMYVGLFLTIVALIVPFVDQDTGHVLAHHVRDGYPTYTQDRIDSAVTAWLAVLSVMGALSIASWVWTIWAVKVGKPWARWAAMAMLVLGTSLASTVDAHQGHLRRRRPRATAWARSTFSPVSRDPWPSRSCGGGR